MSTVKTPDPTPLAENVLRDRIALKNRGTMASLVRQLRTPLSVIPFIGAGMSAAVRVVGEPPRFPPWAELLTGLAVGRGIEEEVKTLLAKGDFEAAASLVDKDRPGVLPQSVRDAFDREVVPSDLTSGALSYLPFLAHGPVITTNYDRVLEQVFTAAGKTFEECILGPRPDATVAAIHADGHVLIKMHGDCRDRTDQVFTTESYEAAYGVASPTGEHQGRIGGLAWLLFTNRPLLFLGSSLEHDRTVDVLRGIRQRLPGISHYAVLAAEKSASAWEKRERHLDSIGVRALWYYPGQYSEIEILIREALERSSTSIPIPPLSPASSGHNRLHPPVSMAIVREKLRQKPAPREKHQAQIKIIAKAIMTGKLAFFLGAYAGLDQSFLGTEFYQRLIDEFDAPPVLIGDRTAAAAYVSNRYGPEALWSAVRRAFAERAADPSLLHRFIAALPEFLREKGIVAPLCVMTTNYDTSMEQALTEAGESFRLLYYVNEGSRGVGCFLERSPDGTIRQIDKAENIRRYDGPEHLVVKLNGGISYFGDMAEQALIERAQFERLAARIPDVLPAYLRRELNARSLLFLGHGLAEPDVGAVIAEYADSETHTTGSWAVQLAPVEPGHRKSWDERARDWQKHGLEMLDDDLERFLAALEQQLELI